jgi:DNA-binding CsgD family transcriptional regulator
MYRLIFIFFLGLIFNTTVSSKNVAYEDSMLRVLKGSSSEAQKSKGYNALSTHFLSSDFKKALEYGQMAITAAQSAGDYTLLMNAYKSVASVFFYSGHYHPAIRQFELCADAAAKANNEFERLNCEINLALIYSSLEKYDKAIVLLENGQPRLEAAYSKSKKAFPIADQVSLKLNLAYNYAALKNYNRAYSLVDSGIHLARNNKSQEPILVKLMLLKAQTLLSENKNEKAILVLKETELMINSIADKSTVLILKSLWGKAYGNKQENTIALKYYHDGYRESVKMGSLYMQQDFANELQKLYQLQGNADSAFKYLKLFNELRKQANLSKAKEELLRKELLDDFSKREKILQQEEQSKQRRFWILTGLLTMLLLVLGIGYFIIRKKYKRSTLEQLKSQLAAQKLSLEQQRLQAQLDNHEKQLAELEYRLSKNAMIQELVEDLQELNPAADITETYEITESEQKQRNKVWNEFEIRFVKNHSGFYERLLVKYPDLSTNERRLCTFLRLDMTTKEIAVITGQSIRAIEIARTRLRKKLNLQETETSLFEHLSSI